MSRFGAVPIVVLALAAGCTRSGPKPASQPTPAPAVAPVPAELRTVPGVSDAARARAGAELGAVLKDLYERAFLPPLPAPKAAKAKGKLRSPTPKPTPVPRPPPGELFTDDARTALEANADAFRPGPQATITRGTVTFSGVATMDGESATSALLSVSFAGGGALRPLVGDPLGVTPRTLRARQTGQLLLQRTASGWRVAGFDVQLTIERLVLASPSPPTQARARWMPA
jgi:hypothetical protein